MLEWKTSEPAILVMKIPLEPACDSSQLKLRRRTKKMSARLPRPTETLVIQRKSSSAHDGPLPAHKTKQIRTVSKCFRTALFGYGVRGCNVGKSQAIIQFRSTKIQMNEGSIEGVASADIIDDFGARRGTAPFLISRAANGGARAAFNYDYLGNPCQQLERLRGILRPGDFFCLTLVWKEQIDIFQNFVQVLPP